jgi:peptidoglycan-associated lipoprotein
MSELISKGRGSGFVVIILALGLAFTWACAKTPVIPEAPKATTAAEPTPGGYELTSIYFDFDSSRITAKAEYTLQKHAGWFKRNRDYVVKIEGHCDQRDTEDYNMDLGQRGAESVKKALVKMGVDAKRISTVSCGFRKPLCSDANEDCWAKNRRGVFVVTRE